MRFAGLMWPIFGASPGGRVELSRRGAWQVVIQLLKIPAMTQVTDKPDTRTPSPPYGYSRECHYPRERQMHIVAEFHANKIRPGRIAYRVGIDIAFIEALIAGEVEAERFPRLVAMYRRQRYQTRMRDSARRTGGTRYELQQTIEREFRREVDL